MTEVTVFCSKCAGSGKILGNGMIISDCHICRGEGRIATSSTIEVHPKNESLVIDRRSKHYKDAIDEIMKTNPEIDKKNAEKMFNKAYEKV